MRKLLIILAFLTVRLIASAAATFTVVAPDRVGVGQKFSVTFRITNAEGDNMSAPQAPQIPGCTLIFGPATSVSRSYQMINGRNQSSSRIEYTYTYVAKEQGAHTIGAVSAVIDGKKMSTKPFKLTVGSSADSSAADRQPRSAADADFYDPDVQTADRNVKASDVFIRIILSKSSAYEQEAIGCTIKLYTKYSISSFLPTRQPSFDGFLIQELPLQQATGQMEEYNGQNYMTAVLKKCVIFPQKSGKLTINSGNYDLDVVQYDQVNMGFFTVSDPRRRKIQVSSNSASIDIRPLPEPRPAGFTGAVGRFSVDTRMVGNTFRTNDPATLLYTITGTGNIKYLQEPVIAFPTDFEQYTPKSDITADIVGDNVTGSMKIEYTFVPQSVGKFDIPGDKFVYFDPEKREYVTIDTPPYHISVVKGSSSPADKSRSVTARNKDILHIHSGAVGSAPSSLIVMSLWYWAIWILLVAALVTVIYIYRRHIARASDIVGMRLAKAGKVARRRLKLARKYLDARKADLFYEEMLRAEWGYLSDKLSMPVSQLTRENIRERLLAYGAPETLVDEFIRILDECEMARYTPGSDTLIGDVYDRAVEAINQMETLKTAK